MSRNSRNTRFFGMMVALLILAVYVGIMYATTYDRCGKQGAKKWEYLPPQWVCVAP